MSDLTTVKSQFLAKVEDYASGQAKRFAPVLDELIRWSDEHGLKFVAPTGTQTAIKYFLGRRVFWAVAPRTGDGAKLTLVADPHIPKELQAEARGELTRIARTEPKTEGDAHIAFTQLIWAPHREKVLALMTRLFDEIRVPAAV